MMQSGQDWCGGDRSAPPVQLAVPAFGYDIYLPNVIAAYLKELEQSTDVGRSRITVREAEMKQGHK
jgi:hypothetical protein